MDRTSISNPPSCLRYRGITQLVSFDQLLELEKIRLLNTMTKTTLARDHLAGWRRRIVAALWEAGQHDIGDAVDACLRYWRWGSPIVCHRYRLCLSCLEWRLDRVRDSDAARLARFLARPSIRRKRGAVSQLVLTSPHARVITSSAWRRVVLGYRRLYLPKRQTYLWIVIATDADPVTRALEASATPMRLATIARRYRAPLEELIQLGPEAAVVNYLATRRALHLTSGSGLFSGRIDRPKKRAARGPATRAS